MQPHEKARPGNRSDYLVARIARDRPDILERMKAGEFARRRLDVHFVSPAPVPSPWERRALARLLKPRWSVALPGETLEDWQCIYETDI